jgi:hypothetical protein
MISRQRLWIAKVQMNDELRNKTLVAFIEQQ